MKIHPVDTKGARHAMVFLTCYASICFVAAIRNGIMGREPAAINCSIAVVILMAMIGIIEWRVRHDGFDAICQKARRLNASQRADLVKILTAPEEQ